MVLSKLYDKALLFVSQAHRQQIRKGAQIPYLSHLLSVSALVMECDGDEEQAIAGLLHDTIEDCSDQFGGAEATAAEIERLFGGRVRRIVEGCTDAVVKPKPPWKARKQAYLNSLAKKPEDTLLVSCCDKLHNARAIVADVEEIGVEVFDRFSAGREQTLWYYGALAERMQAVMGSSERAPRMLGVAVAQMRVLAEQAE